MGKGGNTKALPPRLSEISDSSSHEDAASTLSKERAKKMEQSPGFYWDHDEEPHVLRRQQIIAAHPEIKKLFGIDTSTKYKVLISVLFQVLSLELLQGAPWYTWAFCCYTLSGSINHMMTLAMHELSHNLGAKKVIWNRFLAIFANLPMGIPAAASFKRYHMEHHRYQGEDVIDVDIPTDFEGWFFTSKPKKFLWCLMQPLFYSLRPVIVNPKEPTKWEFVNYGFFLAFDAAILYFYGIGGLLYLVLGTLAGMGVHPVAGHFIAEHYVMHEGQETYSYYGPLNWLTFNVGYHNEHHDFPFVSGKHLADVRKIAPEFYDDIPHYHSWSKVIYDYIFDEKICPYSRTKRVTLSNEEIDSLKARGGLVK
uniref:sphingolipid 4-desaturase n=1 Tax=Attheya septentrionalis TaxID=420275 RepID=A0A7S2XMA6_9STRA|mmetsp:Transcript_18862/g.34171  ORF Transcript_18862/g.34171 Transcript_18862/m.34171 type:complete len:366 (+) Transcript_18862:125-1222(+)|eukprot:CAMPEP_0198292318 /NCGR_PEP_ID=MMETSP1449-20131203/11491_1 /TAXON_ID=420275 /ORGANISM="Attheya septentrionalis, Strain CCMP2084" /LENGTH=365 /DNA_ID=CAMNT_0043991257 /DNA_START=37 /DNA_END=1134 /DNA_ORIENTATION=+